MGVVSKKKEKERKEIENKKYDMRIGIIASIECVLGIVSDIISIYIKTPYVQLVIGILSVLIILYGLNGNRISQFSNNRLLRNIFGLTSTVAVIVFPIEKILLSILDNQWEKFVVCFIFLLLVIAIVGFTIYCIKSEQWKWNED